MVRVFIFAAGAALAVLPGHAENPSIPEARPSIGVYLDFDSKPGDKAVEIMKREVDEILKPSGVALDWRLSKENHGDETFTGLVVVKFRGRCKIETWGPPQPNLADM